MTPLQINTEDQPFITQLIEQDKGRGTLRPITFLEGTPKAKREATQPAFGVDFQHVLSE